MSGAGRPATGSWLAPLRGLILADPLRFAVRAGFVVSSLAVVGWDLPSSFSWENDGLAPRDIFAGISENLRPGHAFRYPLLHPASRGQSHRRPLDKLALVRFIALML